MTPQELHKLQRDRIVASLLLADTRAERHGTYANRKPVTRVAPAGILPHRFVLPVVTERPL